jgi:hypothetical protein
MREPHSAYLSPASNWTGANIEQADRAYYRRNQEASENLRRAIVRYYHKRAGVTFG